MENTADVVIEAAIGETEKTEAAEAIAQTITTAVHQPTEWCVGVKKEYLKLRTQPSAATAPSSTGATTSTGGGEAGNGEKNGKKRPRDERPKGEDRLCRFFARGEACPYAPNCTNSHDFATYFTRKPADLGSTCYQFETFGYCENGLSCRYGDSHINKETGENLKRSADKGGVIPREIINGLSADLQKILRKRAYNFGAKTTTNTTTEENVPPLPTPSPPPSSSSSSSTSSSSSSSSPKPIERDLSPYPEKTVKLVDFRNKVYVAPLTTVGNLPFRRILKEFGADITCGEMAMSENLYQGQSSEWALLRRHKSEDIFGVQLAGRQPNQMGQVARILNNEVNVDFVDLNCGCPIDVVCGYGCGSSLLNKPPKLCEIVSSMTKNLSCPVTVKIRTGWDEKTPMAHKLIPMLQKVAKGRVAAIMIHGRSRSQRYSKTANWDYILEACRSQNKELPTIPIIGNGDILTYEDWQSHRMKMQESMDDPETLGLCSCAMIGRGAIIKPWLPLEIKENRHYDISASERLDILKRFCNYGLEHWGSDTQGVNTTRRFLLEWLSFLHRYTPIGICDRAQKMNQRPPEYFGRCDLETLMASSNSVDWVRISEMLLGPVPDSFAFAPKHKSNSYSNDGTRDESVSNG